MKFEPEKYFVQMIMEILKRDGNEQFVQGKSCDLSELFDPPVGKGKPMRILIRADAGYGKSTLCIKLANDWASEVETFKDFPCESTLVLKYRLRDPKEGQNLEDELIKLLHYHRQYQATELSETKKCIEEYGSRLLLLIDGMDELLPSNQNQVQNILQSSYPNPQSIFKSASIIVTSRLYQMTFSFLSLFHKHFRITGLNKQNRKLLVSKFFKNDEDKILKIENHKDIFNAKSSPLYILLVCWSFSQGMDKRHNSQKELIIDCAHLMAKRSNTRNGFNLSENEIDKNLVLMGKMFLWLEKSWLTTIDTDRMKQRLVGESYRFAILSGILIAAPQRSGEKGFFEAVHKIFQESLAGYYAERTWASSTYLENQMYIQKYHDLGYVNIHAESRIIIFGLEQRSLFYGFKYELESRNFSHHVCLTRDREYCLECARDQMEPLIEIQLYLKEESRSSLVFPVLVNICTEFAKNANYINILHDSGHILSPETCLGHPYTLLRIFDGRNVGQKVNVGYRWLTHEADCVSYTSRQCASVPFTVNTREAQNAPSIYHIDLLVFEREAMSASHLSQYLLGVVKFMTTRYPHFSQAQSLQQCFLIWADFFTELFETREFLKATIRLGNNLRNILFEVSDEKCVIKNYHVDWYDCTMLEFFIFLSPTANSS